MGVAVGRNQPEVFIFMTNGNIYLIRVYNEGESFFKIGITVHRYCRFYEIIKAGYKVDIVYMVMGIPYLDALDYENELHHYFTLNSYAPSTKFGGHTECYNHVDVGSFKERLFNASCSEIVENLPISWR